MAASIDGTSMPSAKEIEQTLQVAEQYKTLKPSIDRLIKAHRATSSPEELEKIAECDLKLMRVIYAAFDGLSRRGQGVCIENLVRKLAKEKE